jgi:hypothetical protein
MGTAQFARPPYGTVRIVRGLIGSIQCKSLAWKMQRPFDKTLGSGFGSLGKKRACRKRNWLTWLDWTEATLGALSAANET